MCKRYCKTEAKLLSTTAYPRLQRGASFEHWKHGSRWEGNEVCSSWDERTAINKDDEMRTRGEESVCKEGLAVLFKTRMHCLNSTVWARVSSAGKLAQMLHFRVSRVLWFEQVFLQAFFRSHSGDLLVTLLTLPHLSGLPESVATGTTGQRPEAALRRPCARAAG